MYLPRFTRTGLVLLACMLSCSVIHSEIQAQVRATSGPGMYQARSRTISNRYQPRFMQSAPGAQDSAEAVTAQPVIPQNETIVGAPVEDMIIADGGYIDGGFTDDCCGAGCSDGRCGGCGPLYDPRDCGVNKDCWIGGLGGILCNSEYFAGVQAFKHQQFQDPQGLPSPENCSFGYHFGFNSGLPLYNLTCGLVSGQVGMNFVRSNLNDGVLPTGNREQVFITAGLFRRVDYGLQFGAVADILNEEYVSELELVQVRSELSWVWAAGSNAGFRFTRGVQDATSPVGGAFLPSISAQAMDTYTLFYRMDVCHGGYAECYIGASDEQHTIFGGDYDLPLTPRTALYASFNYLSPKDELRLTDNEAWNIQMGLTYRPRALDWYKFYHRPLFKVADNGTMVQSRKP